MKKIGIVILGLVMIAAISFTLGIVAKSYFSTPVVEAKEDESVENMLTEDEVTRISRERAVEIVLAYAEINPEDASRINVGMGLEGRRWVYDIDFTANGREYWAEVYVLTGEIHDFGFERND